MGPLGHTVVSSGVGIGVGIATGSPKAGALALGVGVLMDADHLYDFYRWYVKGRPDKIYLLLHAWEYSLAGLVILAAVFYHPLFLATLMAHVTHVATDHFHNRLPVLTYFMTYRIKKGFSTAALTPGYNVMYSYRRWPGMLPFGRKLTPWFRRRIEPWFEARARRTASSLTGSPPSDS